MGYNMQMAAKVIKLDLDYSCDASHAYQQQRHYVSPWQGESTEHFAKRLLAYLSLYEYHPSFAKAESYGKLPDLYIQDSQQHFSLWCHLELIPEKRLQRASHLADALLRADLMVVLDGMQGGTAATQDVFIENVGMPILACIPQAVKALQDLGMHRKVQLIVSGGIRSGADVAKAMALGADVLDIGGESTRPGALPVPQEDEIARVVPAGAHEDAALEIAERLAPEGVQPTTPDPALSLGQVAFTLAVRNLGPATANNARLRDPASAGLDCTAAGLPAPTCTATGGASCPSPLTAALIQTAPGVAIPALPDGGVVSVTLTCNVTATGLP